MKIISPIAIAALALPNTHAKLDKTKPKHKLSTLFHKSNIDANAGSPASQSILDNVALARTKRRESRTGEVGGRRSGGRSFATDVMEKKTNIKRVDIVDTAMSRRSIIKEKNFKAAGAEAEVEDNTEENVEGGESRSVTAAVNNDEADEVSTLKYKSSAEEDETKAENEEVSPRDTIKQQRRGARHTESFKPDLARRAERRKERQERRAARAVAGGAGRRTASSGTMMTERQTRKAAAMASVLGGGSAQASSESATADETEAHDPSKRQRRTSSTPEARKPNPRPGRDRPTTSKEGEKGSRTLADKRSARELRQPSSRTKAGITINNPDQENHTTRNLKKSKKSSFSGSTSGSWSNDWDEYDCIVRLTNLSKEQWFSDIFWMVHSDKVVLPLWAYGFPVFDDLAVLATDGDPYELIDYYEWNNDGVLDVDAVRGPLENGESLFFGIPKSGSYDLFTMATSFIFSNDGFVSIDAGDIEDDATWFLWGLDAGVEANTQLCWTVQASSIDFPPNSECFYVDEDIADENDNSFPGEGYVFVHAGIHDLDDKNDLEDFLAFTCDDRDADSFVEYFWSLGFDDDHLLYDDDRGNNERDDQSFLDFVEKNDEYDNYILLQLAVDAGDFDEFCE